MAMADRAAKDRTSYTEDKQMAMLRARAGAEKEIFEGIDVEWVLTEPIISGRMSRTRPLTNAYPGQLPIELTKAIYRSE